MALPLSLQPGILGLNFCAEVEADVGGHRHQVLRTKEPNE